MRRFTALFLTALAALTFPCTLHAQPPEEGEQIPSLKLVAAYQLPANDDVPLDIRWAGPDSIHVAYEKSGVFEHELGEGMPTRRQLMPDIETMRFAQLSPHIYNLAASSDHMLITSLGNVVAWRKLSGSSGAFDVRTKKLAGRTYDVDVDGGRVLLLGFPSLDWLKDAPGGIVWLGDLDRDLDKWRVVQEDDAMTEGRIKWPNHGASIGSVRFLDNGSFAVAPGILPVIQLFSATGKLKDTWDAAKLLGESDDGEAPPEIRSADDVSSYLSTLRTVDEILPLGDTPAAVLRDPGAKGGKWRLCVLDEPVRWYEIPAPGVVSSARLRGDVDDKGRIVLLSTTRGLVGTLRVPTSTVLVLEIPSS